MQHQMWSDPQQCDTRQAQLFGTSAARIDLNVGGRSVGVTALPARRPCQEHTGGGRTSRMSW
jgi:hypothetical protein